MYQAASSVVRLRRDVEALAGHLPALPIERQVIEALVATVAVPKSCAYSQSGAVVARRSTS